MQMENSTENTNAGEANRNKDEVFARIRRVTILGSIVNILLAVAKIAIGKSSGSMALIADGVHSFGDLISDVAVLAGAKIASKPRDEKHQYGHGKFETLACIFVALVLFVTGGAIAWSAINAFIHNDQNQVGKYVVIAAVVSIGAKEWLYQITRKVGRTVESPAVIANAWHHRSDALSSIAVLFGAVGSLLGWGYADSTAALLVALMIIFVGADMSLQCIHELMEGAIAPEVIGNIEKLVAGHPQVRSFHALRTRKVGNEIFVDVHILVQPEMSVEQSHQITQDLETDLQKTTPNPVNFLIHVEPDTREHRI